jgi:hypothetical protein
MAGTAVVATGFRRRNIGNVIVTALNERTPPADVANRTSRQHRVGA